MKSTQTRKAVLNVKLRVYRQQLIWHACTQVLGHRRCQSSQRPINFVSNYSTMHDDPEMSILMHCATTTHFGLVTEEGFIYLTCFPWCSQHNWSIE